MVAHGHNSMGGWSEEDPGYLLPMRVGHSVSARFNERPCLKREGGDLYRKVPGVDALN